MRKADAESLESMFRSVLKGLEAVNDKVTRVNDKVLQLQAENKELRSLWSECEKMIIERKGKDDALREGIAQMILASNRKQFPQGKADKTR